MVASTSMRLEMVQALLGHRANVALADKAGNTALHFAAGRTKRAGATARSSSSCSRRERIRRPATRRVTPRDAALKVNHQEALELLP